MKAEILRTKSANSRSGSTIVLVLIVAVLTSAVLGSYLRLATTSLRGAESTLMLSSLLNLAEAAAEETVFAINNDSWAGWLKLTNGYYGKLQRNIDLKRGWTGDFVAYAVNTDTLQPTLYIESRAIRPGMNRHLVKQIEIRLGKRSLFANGMTSEDRVRMNGRNFEVNSFDSRLTPDGRFSSAHRRDQVTVGSNSIEPDAIDIGNTTIYGFAATGGALPNVGPNGRIYGADTPVNVQMDMSRVALDFSAEMPPPTAPTMPSGTHTSLPSGNHRSIGTAGGATAYYSVNSLNVSNNHSFTIDGPVVMLVNGDIDIRGDLNISATGHLTLYFTGDLKVQGNGSMNNSRRAQHLVIYGVHTTKGDKDVVLSGNGGVTAAAYIPYANLTMNGGGNAGQFTGAVVAHRITINGGRGGDDNYGFHYDEALADLFPDDSFRLIAWRERQDAGERLFFSSLRTYLSFFM